MSNDNRTRAPKAAAANTPIAQLSTLHMANARDEDALEERKDGDARFKDYEWTALFRRRDAYHDGVLNARAVTINDAAAQLVHLFHEMDFLTSFDCTAEHIAKRLDVMHGTVASVLLALTDQTGVALDGHCNDYFQQRLRGFAPAGSAA